MQPLWIKILYTIACLFVFLFLIKYHTLKLITYFLQDFPSYHLSQKKKNEKLFSHSIIASFIKQLIKPLY